VDVFSKQTIVFDWIVGEKSPFHSLTRILANKRRELVRTPDNVSSGIENPVCYPVVNVYCSELSYRGRLE